jgi:hypothetical protein
MEMGLLKLSLVVKLLCIITHHPHGVNKNLSPICGVASYLRLRQTTLFPMHGTRYS